MALIPLKQRFNSFAALARRKQEGVHYRIVVRDRARSPVAIVAPHGGVIEWHTSKMAKQIAANDHSLYSFEAKNQRNAFYELHVTSSRFDEPRALALVAKAKVTVTVHGCRTHEPVVYLGGRDRKLKSALAAAFNRQGVKAQTRGHPYKGSDPLNICNRNSRGRGVQLEFSRGIRHNPKLRAKCVRIVRGCLRKLTSG